MPLDFSDLIPQQPTRPADLSFDDLIPRANGRGDKNAPLALTDDVPIQRAPSEPVPDVDEFGRRIEDVTGTEIGKVMGNAGKAAAASAVTGTGQLISGVPRAIEGAQVNSQATARRQIEVMDRIDRGEAVPEQDDPLGYQHLTPEQRTATREQYGAALQQMPNVAESLPHRAAEAVKSAAEQITPSVDPAMASHPVVRAASIVGGAAPLVAATLLGGLPGAMASAFTQTYESTYQEATDAGASPEQAHNGAFWNGLTNASLMTVPAAQWLGKLTPELQGPVSSAVVGAITHGGTMIGISEAQKIADNVVARLNYEPDRPIEKGVGEDIVAEGLAGAFIPAVTGALRSHPDTRSAADIFASGARRLRPGGEGEGFTVEEPEPGPQPPAPQQIEGPKPEGVTPTTTEPPADIRAQIDALADPENPKDAVFIAKGTPAPTDLPSHIIVAERPEGTLLTDNPSKAARFKVASPLTDDTLAGLLGYPETKAEAIASGDPQVVQAVNADGAVVGETLVSPGNVQAAEDALKPQVPDGEVRVVSPDEAQHRRAGVSFDDLVPVPERQPRSRVTPYEYPPEPTRLNTFLMRPTVQFPGTVHETTISGGVKDPGGDLSAIIGGPRGRPGLINNASGRSYRDALIHAWQNGYFPEHPSGGEPPDDDRLILDRMRQDHAESPVYSMHDQDAVEAYQYAMAHNAEIDRLAQQHDIDTRGKTRDQFFDELHDRLSQDGVAALESAHDDAYNQAVALSQADGYEPPPGRSLEDLEREYRQEHAAGPPLGPDAYGAGLARFGPDAGGGEEGAGHGGYPAGVAGRGKAEGRPAGEVGLSAPRRLPPPPPAGMDLFGGQRAAAAQRTQEPTIRSDQRQAVMPGMEPSAVQAQAARDQSGRGGLLPSGPQAKANEGLFARAETPQPSLTYRQQVSRWHDMPNFSDLLASVEQARHVAGHETAGNWVRERGKATGHEHIAVVDNHTGEIVHAGTSGRSDFVSFDTNRILHDRDAFTVHHDHPNGTSLSGADLSMLAAPGISHVVAHGYDGGAFAASLGPRFLALRDQNAPDNIRATGLRLQQDQSSAARIAKDLIFKAFHAGEISQYDADPTWMDLTNRILHAHGIINYTSTRALPAPIAERFRGWLQENGHDPDVYDRSTVTIRPEERNAGLPQAVGEQQRPANPSGSIGGAEGPSGGVQRPASRGNAVGPRLLEVKGLEETPDLINEGPPRPPRAPKERGEGPTEPELPIRHTPSTNGGGRGNEPPPPDSLWGKEAPRPQPPVPPEIEAARITAPRAVKNLNALEHGILGTWSGTIFPRTLASLDEASARLWNAWQAREREATTNTDHLRGVIAPSFIPIGKEGRLKVAGALEIARIEGGIDTDPSGNILARNVAIPFARWSQVGDTLRLTPQETIAYHEAVKLGDEQWKMLMRAAAKRFGWGGDIDPKAIRAEANGRGEAAGAKKLHRLADLLDVMRQHQQDVYFPMQRFGSYFIAIRPKEGEGVVAGMGGHPPLAWFETIEKPGFQDFLGTTNGPWSVQAAAAKRIAELRKQFPADRFDVQHGDFARKPALLRQINIPAVEKLFMLMENRVQHEIRDRVMGSEGGPSTASGIKDEAKSQYEKLYGSTLDAFYDALFEELKAGYRRKANVVPGYSDNFDRAIGSHLYQIARNSADMVHRDGIESAYQGIQDYHPHKSVANYWKNWRDYQENPGNVLSRAADTLSQIGFTYVLGMNPSSTIIMASHTPMAAAPVLSVGVGPRAAVPALTRGLGAAYRALRFDTKHGAHINQDAAMKGMTPAKQTFLRLMADEGRLSAVGTHDMAALNDRMSSLFGSHAETARRAMEIATSNVHAVDQANRFAIASAAWDIASDPKTFNAAAAPLMRHSAVFRDLVERDGLSPETFGRFMLSEAAFEWGKQNHAPIMRGPLGKLAFTLHGFQTRYLSTNLNLLKNRGPEGKMAWLLMTGALALGAGALGLPFSQDIMNAGDQLWHHFTGRDPGLKFKLQDAIQDAGFGQIGSEMILYGPVSTALGINLGSRIGFGDVLSREFESSNVLGTIPSIMWSAYSGASKRLATHQEPAAVAAEVVPSAFRGPLRALAASQQGIVSRSGTPIIPAADVSAGDKARMAIGFQPMSVERAQQERSRYYQAQKSLDAIADMVRSGDRAGAAQELRDAGWSPHRIIDFERNALRPRGPGIQFQRFEQRRAAP